MLEQLGLCQLATEEMGKAEGVPWWVRKLLKARRGAPGSTGSVEALLDGAGLFGTGCWVGLKERPGPETREVYVWSYFEGFFYCLRVKTKVRTTHSGGFPVWRQTQITSTWFMQATVLRIENPLLGRVCRETVFFGRVCRETVTSATKINRFVWVLMATPVLVAFVSFS